jgi:hypothetical protein
LPALFFAGAFAVLAGGFAAAIDPRALLTASDFASDLGLAAAFFAAAFLAGFAAVAALSDLSVLAALFVVLLLVLAGFAFFAARFGLPPPLAARSSISAMASGRVMLSCVLSLGMDALTPPAET